MIQRRAILLVLLLALSGAKAAADAVTNRVSFDSNYLSGVSGRTHLVPLRLNPGGAPVGGISFDLRLSPAAGVLKFVGVSAPWAEFNGGLVTTLGSAAPGSANIRVLALNSVCPGALSGDHEALDLYFEVVGPPGSVCSLALSNVVSVTTPAAGTTNEAALVCVTEAAPATFTVSGRVAELQLREDGSTRFGGINAYELWTTGGESVSAFDITLDLPDWWVSVVDVVPVARGMNLTVSRDSLHRGWAHIVGVAAAPTFAPGRPHPVATVFLEGFDAGDSSLATVSYLTPFYFNGVCVDDVSRMGFLEHVIHETNVVVSYTPASSKILTAESMQPGDLASLDLLALRTINWSPDMLLPVPGALDVTLTFPTNVFRFMDATASVRGMDLFYDRAQAATGSVRIVGVTANLDERCRDRLDLATMHLDVREDASAGEMASVRVHFNDLLSLGPMPFAEFNIETFAESNIDSVEKTVQIAASDPPEVALGASDSETLTWGETVEIPVSARLRGRKPVVTMGTIPHDPAQLAFRDIVPSGMGAGGSVVVNTNVPGADTFCFVSLDDFDVPADDPVDLFKIRYDVIGKVHSAGEAGVSLQATAHGVEHFPNKTASAALACLRFNIGESGVDTDGDLMPDWWEYEHFGGRTRGAAGDDSDRDGCPDGEEFAADTDPLDPASKLAITALQKTDASLRLWWQGGTYATQYVETCEALSGQETVWRTVHTNTPPTQAERFIDVSAPTPSSFYRVRAAR